MTPPSPSPVAPQWAVLLLIAAFPSPSRCYRRPFKLRLVGEITSRPLLLKTPVVVCWEHMVTTWVSSFFTHSSYIQIQIPFTLFPLGLDFNHNIIIFTKFCWSLGLSILPLCYSSNYRKECPALTISDQTGMRNTALKKNFAPQHATSIIEKKRVETRSLKKATVAWLHLALISDTHRSTTGIKKKLHLRYNLNTEVQYSFNVLVSFQCVGLDWTEHHLLHACSKGHREMRGNVCEWPEVDAFTGFYWFEWTEPFWILCRRTTWESSEVLGDLLFNIMLMTIC